MDAPREIVASVDYETVNGTHLRMGYVTVGTDGVPRPFDPTHYVRRDVHRETVAALEARIAKADALAAWAKAISERKPSPANGRRMVLERDLVGLETALAAYCEGSGT